MTSAHDQQQAREVERRAEAIREAVCLLRDLRELRAQSGLENAVAIDAAIRDAVEDAESAVILWRGARTEFWSRRAPEAASGARR